MARERSFAQAAMEWEPLVRIYESRLWRRSGFFAALTGLSFDEEARRILAAGAPAEDARVLDLACGSGLYTRRFARAAPRGRVVGLDLSRPMLATAGRLAREEGVASARFVRGSALALPFPDARFDWLNCCGALHLFPDPDAALREVARVLAPGGRFTAAVFRRGETRLEAWAAERRRRTFGVSSFSLPDLAERCDAAGLAEVEALHDGRAWLVVSARKAVAAG